MTVPLPKAESTLPIPTAARPAAEPESFVINLCSSTTPMALTQPQLVELKQYKFFVSRRLEDGRERFRLHMGYFESLLLAEEVLPVVREIYPGAWAGEAPGKRLRAKAAATPVAPVTAAAAAPLAAGPSAEILAMTPTLSAAPEPKPVTPPAFTLELVATPPRAPMVEMAGEALAPVVAAPAPKPAPKPAPPPAPPPRAARTAVVAPATTAARTAPPPASAKREPAPPFDQRSNVREVLKSLDESAGKAAKSRAPAPAAAPPAPAARKAGTLPESQVLHLLEEKRGDPLNTTSTPAAFSVQLQWSVQSIDLARVPQLAIFGAYTLYTVEGSREGRRWYGLRLGFFSDANSAKQVAQYVRSDFSSVAVVPVSLKERDGASGATGGSGAAAPQRPTERLPERSGEFKLLDDTGAAPKVAAAAAAVNSSATKPKSAAAPAAAAPAGRPKTLGASKHGLSGRVPGKTARSRVNRLQPPESRVEKTLEETLEILGADQLQIDDGRKKPASGGSVRHLDMKVQKNSPFSRLLDRLAERNR